MKILITGGSGFIGTHLIELLLRTKSELEICNLDINEPVELFDRVTYYKVDIRDKTAIESLSLPKQDLCIHLAALCKEPGFEWDEYFETNHRGTCNVLELCSKFNVKKVLFTSTMMVYKAGEERRTEKSITSPDTAYGISKLLAEKEIERWAENDSKKEYGILRPSVVFGKNENGNFTRLYKALKSNKFAYVGRNTTVKSCVYVKEVCNALLFLMDKKVSQTFNFAFIEDYQIKIIVLTFKKTFGIKPIVPIIPLFILKAASSVLLILNNLGLKNSIHPRRIQKLYYSTNIDSQKIIDLGFSFKYDLESALQNWKKDCENKELH